MTIAQDQLTRLAHAVELMTAATKVTGHEDRPAPARKMPPSEIAALLFIGRHEGAKLGDVAEHLRIGPTTASGIVERLVKSGAVRRERPEDDRRSLRLSLTEPGSDIRREVEAEQQAWCHAMLGALEPAERGPFIDAMTKIAASLAR